MDKIEQEHKDRMNMWDALHVAGGPKSLQPAVLANLNLYRGGRGIWMDKTRTQVLTSNGEGVTVSLLHTVTSYADDLSADGVIYHYPNTKTKGRDDSEIEATKMAGQLGLPVFVIAHPAPNSSVRDVYLGWVEDWDDAEGQFLVTFSITKPPVTTPDTESTFTLFDKTPLPPKSGKGRPGQQKFKFNVTKRYGGQCAVCTMSVPALLDAPHICPKEAFGCDHWGNGIVLCASHHRALDAGHFAIHPDTLNIVYKPNGPSAKDLQITSFCINHLPNKPHKQALMWRWQRWNKND